MWTVARPNFDVEETFATCTRRIRSVALRARMEDAANDVVASGARYAELAARQELHLFPRNANVAGVTRDEMVATYDLRMAKKGAPGRSVYDAIKLLPEYGTCPFCDHNVVSTLDHILPKALYPVLAVTPDNLVGCCKDCNNAKLAAAPVGAADAVLHPYFDDITGAAWLTGRVIEGAVAAVLFRPEPQDVWPDGLNKRIASQFKMLGLGRLYSQQAARTISGLRTMLIRVNESGGAKAVRDELARQHKSWLDHRLNCWQAAAFLALSENEWYCEEGYQL
jgi:5-methylcytosine-specific restriction endonuclease McrA